MKSRGSSDISYRPKVYQRSSRVDTSLFIISWRISASQDVTAKLYIPILPKMRVNGVVQWSILVLLPAWCHCQGQQPKSGDNIVTPWVVGRRVETTSGTIIGHAASKRRNVSEYLGIPYAEAPIGNLRFSAPRPYYGKKNITALNFVGSPQQEHPLKLDTNCL